MTAKVTSLPPREGDAVRDWFSCCGFAASGPLHGKHSSDVAIVGGGLTGLTAALLLKREGNEVIVIDAQRVHGRPPTPRAPLVIAGGQIHGLPG